MNEGVVFRCWKCDRRLNVDAVEGAIRVVVYCKHCKTPNRIEQAAPRFRECVEVKA